MQSAKHWQSNYCPVCLLEFKSLLIVASNNNNDLPTTASLDQMAGSHKNHCMCNCHFLAQMTKLVVVQPTLVDPN